MILALTLVVGFVGNAAAGGLSDHDVCWAAAATAAKLVGGPERIFKAVVRTESDGWPWTLNVDGEPRRFASRAEATTALVEAVSRGQLVDAGCWQVNMRYHGHLFRSPSAALDPASNTAAAVRYLTTLYRQSRSWGQAVSDYHNRNATKGTAYACRVLRKLRQDTNCMETAKHENR